jgi:hypothetical protein
VPPADAKAAIEQLMRQQADHQVDAALLEVKA